MEMLNKLSPEERKVRKYKQALLALADHVLCLHDDDTIVAVELPNWHEGALARAEAILDQTTGLCSHKGALACSDCKREEEGD